MPILTKSGRVAIAKAVAQNAIHLAWGIGDGAWIATVPPEDANATSLISELGRRIATEVAFVSPDPAGDIVLPTDKFSRSVTPTNHLYIRTQFEFEDSPSSVVREIGVYVGTVTDPALPPGQQYFVPADLDVVGTLLHLEHFPPIYRSPAIREEFEIVVTF